MEHHGVGLARPALIKTAPIEPGPINAALIKTAPINAAPMDATAMDAEPATPRPTATRAQGPRAPLWTWAAPVDGAGITAWVVVDETWRTHHGLGTDALGPQPPWPEKALVHSVVHGPATLLTCGFTDRPQRPQAL